MPPVAPMLAKSVKEIPTGDLLYEPKWDGFRCIVFRDGDEVELSSRGEKPLTRYFPELVDAVKANLPTRCVIDGEIVIASGDRLEFEALLQRIHPAASRVNKLAVETPASFVAFDLLALGDLDLMRAPFRGRRTELEQVVAEAGDPIFLTQASSDVATAHRWFETFEGAGLDGIVAKPLAAPYQPDVRAMFKVKHERTADCVVAGIRLLPGPAVSSLLLGLYDRDESLRHVGVVTQMPLSDRRLLVSELGPLVVPLEEHPWRHGFTIGRSPLGRLKGSASRWTPDMEPDWVPLRPERVCEVGFDQVDVDRFRHPARLLRWRPDRTAESCRLEQVEAEAPDLGEILGAPLGA